MTVPPQEIRERIEAPEIWYVATVDADGAPHVSPMWVGLDGDLLFFNTAVGRVKERNLRRDPRVCLSHADRADLYDRVQIRGRAVRLRGGTGSRPEHGPAGRGLRRHRAVRVGDPG